MYCAAFAVGSQQNVSVRGTCNPIVEVWSCAGIPAKSAVTCATVLHLLNTSHGCVVCYYGQDQLPVGQESYYVRLSMRANRWMVGRLCKTSCCAVG
jgi:hypothetical protein